MDSSKLADRLRGIVKASTGTPRAEEPAPRARLPIDDVLGGTWRRDGTAASFVIDRRMEAAATHGGERVGDLAARLERTAPRASTLTGAPASRPPFMFFDLETTGLSGGAGTYAFLVGCAWFADDGTFATRQHLLVRHADERQMLESVRRELERAGVLVSFNGKSFDAPVLETRYQYHRLEWIGARLPHLDVLPPARRFWGSFEADSPRASRSGSDAFGARRVWIPKEANAVTSCSLVALEHQLLGAARHHDVSGSEIPSRYFQFLRSGDARPLRAVLEHNRLDLLTLAALTVRLLRLVDEGPRQVRSAREALALGRVYLSSGDQRAVAALERALEMTRGMPRPSGTAIAIDALRFLAVAARRARRYDAAAGHWRQLLEVASCPRHVAREAMEALAIHHEHRVRDLPAAKVFALKSLEYGGASWGETGRYRIMRIERKIQQRGLLLPD